MTDADPAQEQNPGSPSSQSKYPEPVRAANSAYPALHQRNGSYSSPASAQQPYASPYGLFPGSRGNSGYTMPDAPITPSARQSTANQRYDHAIWGGVPPPTSSRHHVTDFGAFIPTDRPMSNSLTSPLGGWGGPSYNQASHLTGPYSSARPSSGGVYPDAAFDPSDADQVNRLLSDQDLQIAMDPHRTKTSTPKRGRGGKVRRGWKQLLKGTEHEHIGTSRENKPRTRARGTSRAARKRATDPGRDFKECVAKASKAFFDGDLEKAADFARQAVKANPEVFQAHSLLSEILKAQGHDEDSVQALWFGAITIRNSDVWRLVAEKTLEVDDEDRSPERIKTAIECYGEAIKICKDINIEYELRVAKLNLYLETKNIKFARLDCKNILKQWPGKSQYVKEYAQLTAGLQDSGELQKSLDAYENCFDIYKDGDIFGDEEDENDPWDHLNIYLELLYHCGDPADGLEKAKRYARWFIGRQDEEFWDRYVDDDREWDSENDRRVYVGEFQQGKASRDKAQYGDGLPIDIRVRMGLFRMKMGMKEEALRHFEPLLLYSEDVDEYHDMFLQTANSLRADELLQEAAVFLDALRGVSRATILDQKVWMQMGTCYMSLERPQDAIQCFEAVISMHAAPRRGQHYTTLNGYAKAGALLAKLYEDAGDIDKARFMCNDLIRLGRRDLLTDAKVRMIPANTRYAFTPGTSELDPQQPKSKSRKRAPEHELRPDGPLPDGADPEDFPTTAKKPRKRKPKVKDGDAPLGGEEGSGIRKRKRVKKRDIVGEDGEQTEDGSSVPKRPRLQKPQNLGKKAREAEERYRKIADAEGRALTNYAVIQSHWASFEEATDEDSVEQWMGAASSMMEDFMSMKVFFPSRDKNVPMKISEDSSKGLVRDTHHAANRDPHQFLSIPFAAWHHMFVSMAVYYSKTGEQDKCYKILQDILWGANVFYLTKDLRRGNYAVSLYCALAFNDSQYWIELARKVITDSDYSSADSYQLLAALNRFSTGSNWFSSGPAQKFMLRMVKQYDYLSMTPSARKQIDWSIQGPSLATRAAKEAEAGHKTALDAGVLMIYGHMVAQANHSHSALPYFFRALALQPDNICVHLSIAAMFVQNSMKRQTDNRQFGINQGLSALFKYYDLRVASGKACDIQEAEYNVARMWHHLGLTHLAIPGYEKVLELSPQVQAEYDDSGKPEECEIEDFASEAAFALQGFYALAGNDEAAQAIGEEWLVI